MSDKGFRQGLLMVSIGLVTLLLFVLWIVYRTQVTVKSAEVDAHYSRKILDQRTPLFSDIQRRLTRIENRGGK